MNIYRFHYLFGIVLLSCSCSFTNSPSIYVEPNKWSGKRVVFADLDDNYKRTNNFNRVWSKIRKDRYRPYFKFLGKRYTIVGTLERLKNDFLVIKDMNGNQYKMELIEKGKGLEYLPSYLLFDDLEKKAKNMIGKKVWLNNSQDLDNFYTFSDYQFKRFERVTVLDLFPFQNKDSGHPVWLKIQSRSGDKGYVRYNGDEGRVGMQDHYYTSEPLPSSLGKRLINKILNKEIEIGMEDRQVRISIGNPDKVNTTSSRHGVGEQWIFTDIKGNKTYYQFEYGKLTYVSN